ncbi:hybrid sensor histidine kinase/response regulator [Persicobacter diffluens]|uniref:histidine kinase n=1 Tax=Persicobacter diffluens TaxID=981 RepID=A0AAN4VYM5_9BACT|nr:hybrid sensor histidine kinase/response regulator [Persicobacter diffluens]
MSFADSSDLYFEAAAKHTNISGQGINAMLEDEDGFFWLATWRGLYRYDGYEAINYSLKIPQLNKARKVTCLLYDQDKIWLGTFVEGLFCYHLKTGIVEHFAPEALVKDVITLTLDHQGNLWVGSEADGLCKIKPNNEVEKFDPGNTTGMKDPKISQIIEDQHQRLWVASENALSFFDQEHKELVQALEFAKGGYVYSASLRKDNRVILATREGLLEVPLPADSLPSGQTLAAHPLDFKAYEKYNNFCHALLSERNELWIGTANGLLYQNQDKVIHYGYQQGLHSEVIQCLMKDRFGNLWLGTGEGLFKAISKNQHLAFLPYASDFKSIKNIISGQGELILGSFTNGLFRVRENGSHESINLKSASPFLEDAKSIIFDVAFDASQALWVSTKGAGVFRLRRNAQGEYEQTDHFFAKGQFSEFRDNHLLCITSSPDGRVYFGAWEGIIYYFDPVAHKVKEMPIVGAFKNYPITQILIDQEGIFWVGTRGGGVFSMEEKGQQFQVLQQFNGTKEPMDIYINEMYESSNGKIWVGTENGLFMIKKGKAKSIPLIPLGRQITEKVINGISEDLHGFLWITSESAIFRINSNRTEKDHINIIDSSDGLRNHYFSNGIVSGGKQGKFYISGDMGLDILSPYDLKIDYDLPQPKITRLMINGREVKAPIEGSGEKLINYRSSLELSNEDRTFSFEFSALQLEKPDKCLYAYQLEGYDADWIFSNALNRRAQYTNVPAGRYVFKLKAANPDGVWNDEASRLEIIIYPPFWRSDWAYGIYLLLLLSSLVGLYFYYRSKHLDALRKVEQRKEGEINTMRLNFFANISHEFRTPLTLILGPLAKLVQEHPGGQYGDLYGMMYRNANRLLLLVNRLLDFQKAENSELKLQVQHSDLSVTVRNLAELFKFQATHQKVNYEIYIAEDLPDALWFSPDFIEGILFNLLSNAFKYTPSGQTIRLKLSKEIHPSHKGGEWIQIKVADTGSGISEEHLPRIFEQYYTAARAGGNSVGIGLSFTRKLVELHKGMIEVSSQVGVGTEFRVYLPLEDVYKRAEKAHHPSRPHLPKIDLPMPEELMLEGNDQKPVVLIVDDHADVLSYLKEMLSPYFQPLTAMNGREALLLAQEQIPDIIISDVMMPEMNGFEFCKELKTHPNTDHIPLILVTALNSERDRIEGLKAGADSFIPKPLNTEHLLVRIDQLLKRQKKLQEKHIGRGRAYDASGNHQDNSHGSEVDNFDEISEVVKKSPLLEKADRIILEQMDDPDFGVDKFCEALAISRMQLYRKLKAITGMSANAYIRKVRMRRAAELLEEGELNIKQVTYDVGFTDLKYFRKCFKEEFGVNPSEFSGDKVSNS